MAIRLNINGGLILTFLGVYSDDTLEKWVVDGILDNLQNGEYVISLADKTVADINNLNYPLYRFEFEVEDDTDYEFETIINEDDFINEWGQTHEEICSNLGYDVETSDDLLVDDYFFHEKTNKWLPKDSSMYSDAEQLFADEFWYNLTDLGKTFI